MALAKLETTTYYQGRKSVDDYIDDFRELVEQAGYSEGLPMVVKFRKGLNREIQDQIAQLAVGRPRDDNVDAWFEAAVRADENRIANNLFHATPKANPSTPRTSGYSFPTSQPTGTSSWPNRTPTFSSPKPSPLSNPVPMEIDRTKKKSDLPDTCRRCGGTGHWSKDCPQRFDIRFMSGSEKEEWMQQLVLEADTKDLEEKAEQEEEEDFPECSR